MAAFLVPHVQHVVVMETLGQPWYWSWLPSWSHTCSTWLSRKPWVSRGTGHGCLLGPTRAARGCHGNSGSAVVLSWLLASPPPPPPPPLPPFPGPARAARGCHGNPGSAVVLVVAARPLPPPPPPPVRHVQHVVVMETLGQP